MTRQQKRAKLRAGLAKEVAARYIGSRRVRRKLARELGNFVSRNERMARLVTIDELFELVTGGH